MKTFIAFAPQQPEGKLQLSHYIPQGNTRLEYGETRFPIMPVINGYADPGEQIHVILVVQDHDHCRHNETYFRQELEALMARKNLSAWTASEDGSLYDRVEVPYDDAVSAHIQTLQKLIDMIRDGDDLHACITYGSKPAPMVELMALRYARQIKKGCYISCIVYGQYDWDKKQMKLYDETALAHLDDIVRMLAEYRDPNPKATLDRIIAM